VIALAPVTGRVVVEQVVKTSIVLAVLVAGFRLLGKREAAQLNVYDLAMLMALANGVQNAMTGGLGNLRVGLALSSTILVAAWVVTRFILRHPRAETRLVGTPTLLVNQGQVISLAMRRQQVSHDELLQACRQHGVDAPSAVQLGVLEVDGSISIIPASDQGPDGAAGPAAPAAGAEGGAPAAAKRRLRRWGRRRASR
jgi:uncharacterized membrane protein YcaP (DUF421 family)